MKTMEYVGILAKLELKDEEKESARQDMQKMLDYVDKLNELDTSKVEPMTHIFEMGNVFREDEVTNGDDRDANACQCTGSQRGPVQGSENGRIAGGDSIWKSKI